MKFQETKLKGAFTLELEKREDSRGFFARSFCRKEFEAHGLNPNVVQANYSYNAKQGTLRGMHFQRAPYAEAKIISVAQGAIYDVIVDLREGSPTYKQWVGVELSAENRRSLYVPEGFAHGFLTLQDGTAATYLVTQFYTPSSEGGVRYNDPQFGIVWPRAVAEISDKDKSWPDFKN